MLLHYIAYIRGKIQYECQIYNSACMRDIESLKKFEKKKDILHKQDIQP